MLENILNEHILFIDIETVPVERSFDDLNKKMQKLWDKKSSYFREKEETPEDIYNRAGIYAEFGKIICISAGFLYEVNKFRIKSFYGHDEGKILNGFADLLSKSYCDSDKYLCAHNGKEFDYPYIARRMLINGIRIPDILDLAGKKPWEVKHLDTLELWKFGDYKNYTSLELLTEIFNIPTPKDDIDGSMVADVYWKDDNIDRIVEYCEKDVLAVAQLFLKYKNQELIEPNKVISV